MVSKLVTNILVLFAITMANAAKELDLRPYNNTATMLFNQEDRNGDGFLSPNETIGAFFKFDINRDFLIERKEYICYQIIDHPEIGNFANAVFDEYDANNNTVLEESDLIKFYDRMDMNADSNVTLSEFVDFWTELFERHEGFLLHGHVHPLHDPHACKNVSTGPSFGSNEEIAAAIFAEEDDNGDGKLTSNETIAAFFKFDFNEDSRIERNEYICYQIMEQPEIGHFANAIFDEYDYNNDSVLEQSDLLHFFNSMDADGNSEVSQDEFVLFWVQLLTQHAGYLKGQMHPAHNPHACQHVNTGFNFHPYDKYAETMFKSEDSDKDGQLSLAESIQSFNHYDANGDRNISRLEYACYQRDLHHGLGDIAHAVFDEYDADGDDVLTDADIRAFYMKMDKDGNSIVTQTEFVNFWERIFVKYENYHIHGAHHPANGHDCPQN